MKNKKSFVLYCDLRETLIDFSIEDKGHLFSAILDFQNNEPINLPPHLIPAFAFLKTQFARDSAKYSDEVEKRRLAGIKSGEARRLKSEQTGTKRTSVRSVEQNEQTGTKRSDSENVSDSDNVNDNPNNNLSSKQNIKSNPKEEKGDFKNFNKGKIINSVDSLLIEIGEKGLETAKKYLKEKGLDVYEIAKIYVSGIPTRGIPDDWTGGFIGYCKTISNKTISKRSY